MYRLPLRRQLRVNVISGRIRASLTAATHASVPATTPGSLCQSQTSVSRAVSSSSLRIAGSWNVAASWSPMPTSGRADAAAGTSRAQANRKVRTRARRIRNLSTQGPEGLVRADGNTLRGRGQAEDQLRGLQRHVELRAVADAVELDPVGMRKP